MKTEDLVGRARLSEERREREEVPCEAGWNGRESVERLAAGLMGRMGSDVYKLGKKGNKDFQYLMVSLLTPSPFPPPHFPPPRPVFHKCWGEDPSQALC